jgi:hypothetical protein
MFGIHFDPSDFFRAFLTFVAVYFGTKHGPNGNGNSNNAVKH